MINKICEICGVEFQVRNYRRDTARFCSRACQWRGQEAKVGVKCWQCGKTFAVIPQRAKTARYCSQRCYFQTLKDWTPSIAKECAWCGAQFNVPPSHADQRCCSQSCSASLRWDGYRPRWTNGLRGKYQRAGLLERCEWCGYSAHPEILELHHKDRDKKNNKRKNIAVLCPNCHKIEHYRLRDASKEQGPV